MTSTITPPPPPPPPPPVAALPRPTFRPATFADAMRSEWTKLRSVRSTYWALIVAAILGIGLGALISGISASHYATDPGIRAGWDPTDRAIRSLSIAQLA